MEVDERCVDVKIAVSALVVGIDVDVVQTIGAVAHLYAQYGGL